MAEYLVLIYEDETSWAVAEPEVMAQVMQGHREFGDRNGAATGGNDMISGGPGQDTLRGNPGNDVLYGDEDADIMKGEAGDDQLYGGAGDDDMEGNDDNDVLCGDSGADVIKGQVGDDTLYGGAGGDDMQGNDNDDCLFGEAGVDTIHGNAGNDFIDGGEDDGFLYGDEDHDVILVGSGQDHIDAVATRWRGQLAENAKTLSSAHVFPEMNHNEIVGWDNPRPLLKQCIAVLLRDRGDRPRVARRMDITATLLKRAGFTVLEVGSTGRGLLARIFSLIYTGDFVSYYLSLLNRRDPTPVERIARLKKELARR